ncbi:hypothetical protein [Flavobacterium tistrianum]|nr:hypothetical protein [Flavobacterium tistrianum]
MKAKESELAILKKAIQDGLESGRAESFSSKKHLENLKLSRNARK